MKDKEENEKSNDSTGFLKIIETVLIIVIVTRILNTIVFGGL